LLKKTETDKQAEQSVQEEQEQKDLSEERK
jgi:hypothetical protein